MSYKRVQAIALWCMLDDIDTYSDMTRGDYDLFYKLTMKKVAQRHKILQSDGHILTGLDEDPATAKYAALLHAIKETVFTDFNLCGSNDKVAAIRNMLRELDV